MDSRLDHTHQWALVSDLQIYARTPDNITFAQRWMNISDNVIVAGSSIYLKLDQKMDNSLKPIQSLYLYYS